jgi:hypothetical protein
MNDKSKYKTICFSISSKKHYQMIQISNWNRTEKSVNQEFSTELTERLKDIAQKLFHCGAKSELIGG